METVSTDNINDYFDLLQDVFEKKGFADHHEAIYNMDETGMPLEPRPPKVVAQKGQRKVRYRIWGQK